MQSREALFISHANPEDNAFARWLGAKLAAMGYEVWADVMRLRGGSDWSRELEVALRMRAIKLLLVGTPTAVGKQGVRNEIEIGAQLSKSLKDPEFIIPLRLKPYDAPVRMVQAQYVDFSEGWAAGLAELVELLSNVYKIPRRSGKPIADWLMSQSLGSATLVEQPEQLVSNWLLISKLPEFVYYCARSTNLPLELFQDRTKHTWPVVPFNEGVLTFATPDKDGFLAPEMPSNVLSQFSVSEFLESGWPDLKIDAFEARRQFSDLSNQAFENFLRGRGLTQYEGAGGRLTWWGNIRTVPLTQIRYGLNQQRGRRQIIGVSAKRNVHWHYGINVQVRTAPVRHARLSARIIFTENGLDAIADVKRMHRLRRSFAKSWRNARWRDMMLAFLWWVAGGQSEIALPISDNEKMILALPTASFVCPVSVLHAGELPPDEDDPDVEPDYWDEASDEVIGEEEKQ
ncbi:MAG TPA: hypothetical protein DC047_03785 [Blastocatellia bacterium]|nr:hypothetical protein [Blastocatellia bacterium]